MSNPIDDAYARFLSLRHEIEAALSEEPNESDTRLKALDRILFDVLDWPYDAVHTEFSSEAGYLDYLLTAGDGRGVLVIEAKRSGHLRPTTRSVDLVGAALKGPVLKTLLPAVRQAMSYALDNGVSVAVVTDGTTWLFFRGSRTDGQRPVDGKGILFPNLDTIADNFTTFYELLSASAIEKRLHIAHLNELDGLTVPEAEQQFYVLQPQEARMRKRDALASDAALLFTQFFSRLSNERDREMLRECFVETSESQKADLDLEKLIQRVVNSITPLDTDQSGALQKELERAITANLSETILIVGNKGAGKSTFIDRFFEQVLPSRIRDRCVLARVDLERFHGDPTTIIPWAILQLRSQLEQAVCTNQPPSYDDLQGIFFSEYQRLSTGPRKHLYETNKIVFKDEFGQHVEKRREQQPDEYVKLLLQWSIKGNYPLDASTMI